MNLEEQIKMYEEQLKDEMKICNRIAHYHTNSKDMISSLKLKIKELRERQKAEK